MRRDARLVLLGDPGQLTSVEAGAVLGDIVGPAADTLRMSEGARSRLSSVVGHDVAAEDPPEGVVLGDGIVVLDRVRRYGGGIAAVAEAIRRGDGDATIAALEAGAEDVQWIAEDVAAPRDPAALDVVREGAVQAGRAVNEAARAGDALAALEAQGRFRILCAHRRGDHGVSTWNTRVEGWLAAALQGFDASTRWHVGRPVLITANDHELRLYNGDAGVAVADGDRVRVAFERRGGVLTVSPARLEAVETLYAMTIHKAQGSQVGTAAVLLPAPSPGSSPVSCSTRRSRVRRSASCSSASRRRSARRWRGRSRGRRDCASASGTSADSPPRCPPRDAVSEAFADHAQTGAPP